MSVISPSLLAAEQQWLNKWLPAIFGYHLLAISDELEIGAFSHSKIPHRMLATRHFSHQSQLCLELAALPFAKDSLDCVLLHHQLEYSDDLTSVLREAERVLISHGQLIIIGFNPQCFLSLWQRLNVKKPRYKYHLRSINELKRLLAESDLVIEESAYCLNLTAQWRFLERLRFKRGGSYALRIRKKTPCLILLKANHQTQWLPIT